MHAYSHKIAAFTLTIANPAFAYLALVRQGVESADVPNSGDNFGYTVVAGDFNKDGRDDLVVAGCGSGGVLREDGGGYRNRFMADVDAEAATVAAR